MRSFPELIAAKRDGHSLSDAEMRHFLTGAVDGSIPDYQVSAMLMAIYFSGMGDDELASFTDAMIESGSRLSIDVEAPLVDKHSTGGVGDKVSLALAPLIAASGAAVPMMSGRGLGHTGGTLDKLESVPGLRTDFTRDEFAAIVSEVGCIIAGQSDDIVPADRKLYSLRDTTATVASIPLIASSIMSKKLAEGLDALVLDIKVGTGAFMKTLDDARLLAHAMWAIGHAHGVTVECLITRMDDPLGNEIGNANELREAIDVLRVRAPWELAVLVFAQAEAVLTAAGIDVDDHALGRRIDDGSALTKLERMIEAQGGDPAVVTNPDLLPSAADTMVVEASQEGVVASIDSLTIGRACVDLGAGRTRAGEAVDHAAGTTLLVRRGDAVSVGQPLAELRCSDGSRLEGAVRRAATAFTIADEPDDQPPLIIDRYSGPS